MKKLFTAIWLLALFTIPVFWQSRITNPFRHDPTIILVGDFKDSHGFGRLVESGVREAQRFHQRKPDANNVEVHLEKIDIAGALKSNGLHANNSTTDSDFLLDAIINTIAKENVIAIISANVSDKASVVLNVAAKFDIPVLLTVATNEKLLYNTAAPALRFPPPDSKQAKLISQWCMAQSNHCAIIYDRTRYADDLREALTHTNHLGPLGFVSFRIGDGYDIAEAFEAGIGADVRSWVFLGYPEDAANFIAKKSRLKIPGAVLLSDGAYGSWINSIHSSGLHIKDLQMTFPRPNDSNTPVLESVQAKSQSLKGFAVYGFDAYLILTKAINSLATKPASRNQLTSAIREAAQTLSEDGRLYNSYKFSPNGENEVGRFGIFNISENEIP